MVVTCVGESERNIVENRERGILVDGCSEKGERVVERLVNGGTESVEGVSGCFLFALHSDEVL